MLQEDGSLRDPANHHVIGALVVILRAGAITQRDREVVEAESNIHRQLGRDLPLIAGISGEILGVRVVIIRPLKDLAGILGIAQQKRGKRIVFRPLGGAASPVREGGAELRRLLGEMEPARAADVAAAGWLILAFPRILNVGVEAEPEVVISPDPSEIGVVVSFRIPIVLGLEAAHRTELRNASVDRQGR